MDKERFDSLARAMATGKSRRDVLKLLSGGAAGGALAVTAFDDASAECHAISCSSDANCCPGAPYCVSVTCQTQMAAPDPAPAAPDPAPAAPAAETGTGGTAAVTTVPATGIAPEGADSGVWMGAAVAGGAALLASRILRRDKADARDSA